MGSIMISRIASEGVLSPFRMSATPKRIGNLRSIRYERGSFSRRNSTRERAVAYPSATSVVEVRMSSNFSPWPRRNPSWRFRDNGPKHVPNVSPTPLSPISVTGEAPMAFARACISRQPRVTSPAIAFVPIPNPSHIPAAIAITFLTAPPISTPATSFVVKTRKVSHENISATSFPKAVSLLATTTAVASPMAISFANDGPERKA
mmetsp:Transcript_21343/g.51392  ORF Transcript_21343/g.51392 Transcript_21343/m.51392 type:complete len:205 (+) Transcript_21343:201-815(+)